MGLTGRLVQGADRALVGLERDGDGAGADEDAFRRRAHVDVEHHVGPPGDDVVHDTGGTPEPARFQRGAKPAQEPVRRDGDLEDPGRHGPSSDRPFTKAPLVARRVATGAVDVALLVGAAALLGLWWGARRRGPFARDAPEAPVLGLTRLDVGLLTLGSVAAGAFAVPVWPVGASTITVNLGGAIVPTVLSIVLWRRG